MFSALLILPGKTTFLVHLVTALTNLELDPTLRSVRTRKLKGFIWSSIFNAMNLWWCLLLENLLLRLECLNARHIFRVFYERFMKLLSCDLRFQHTISWIFAQSKSISEWHASPSNPSHMYREFFQSTILPSVKSFSWALQALKNQAPNNPTGKEWSCQICRGRGGKNPENSIEFWANVPCPSRRSSPSQQW